MKDAAHKKAEELVTQFFSELPKAAEDVLRVSDMVKLRRMVHQALTGAPAATETTQAATQAVTMKIVGCRTCPLAGMDGRVRRCQHPASGHQRAIDDREGPPTWCPLRERPLTLAIKESR